MSRLCKKCIYESKRLFYAMHFKSGSHQVVAVTWEVAQSLWERTTHKAKKIEYEYERKHNDPTTIRPRVKTKHGFLAKPVVNGTPEVHSSRGGGQGACSPGKIFKMKLARIALVAILRL